MMGPEWEVEAVFWVRADNAHDAKAILEGVIRAALMREYTLHFKAPIDPEFYINPDKIVPHEEDL